MVFAFNVYIMLLIVESTYIVPQVSASKSSNLRFAFGGGGSKRLATIYLFLHSTLKCMLYRALYMYMKKEGVNMNVSNMYIAYVYSRI